MRAYQFLNETKTTLSALYKNGLPDRDEQFWDEVTRSDLDIPLEINKIAPYKLGIILTSQYRVEHIDELVLTGEQKRIINRYKKDPNLSDSIIVMSDGRIIDGNHRALAAYLTKRPINYIDLSELNDEQPVAEGSVDPTQQDLTDVADWMNTTSDKIKVVVKQEPIEKFLQQIREMYSTYDEFPKDAKRTNRIVSLLKKGEKPLPIYVEANDPHLFAMEGRHRMVAFWLAGMKTIPVAYVYRQNDKKQGVAEGSPNFNREWDEATRYPEFVNLGKEKWIELVSKGKQVTVTRKNVNKINNTDAADPKSFKLLDTEKQKRALAQLANGDVEMPIVARYSDGYLELIGGNTRLTAQMAKDGQAKVWLFNVPEELTQGVTEGSIDNNPIAQKIFFARSKLAPKGYSYDHVGFITQDGKQIQMSGHKGNEVYVTNAVTDDPEFPKQTIKIVSLSKPVSVPTTNTVGAENCGTFVANVLQANGIKGIDLQKLYSVFKPGYQHTQPVAENFADGKGPGRPGDSVRHGIPKKATMSELEKASHSVGRKGQLARWQLNMRRGKAKGHNESVAEGADDEIHNYKKLDHILATLCELVVQGQQHDPEKYGMVAACVLDPDNQVATGINLPAGNGKRRHAERVAIDKYHKEYGKIPPGSIILTTCSPCSEHMDERYGEDCTQLINSSGVKKVYCGFDDPTQPEQHREFNCMETANGQIRTLCSKFAEQFLDTESKNPVSEAVVKKSNLKTYAARVRLKQLGYTNIVDATVSARNPEMARRLLHQLYGGNSSVVGQPREIK